MFRAVRTKGEQRRNGLLASMIFAVFVGQTLAIMGVSSGWQTIGCILTGCFVGSQQHKWWPVEVDKKAGI